MIKIIHNNLIIDVCKEANYVRFLPNNKRFVRSNKEVANGIIGSDDNTIYHLKNTPYNFLNDLKTVNVVEINEEEYNRLTTEKIYEDNSGAIQEEVNDLKKLVLQQNELIAQLLKKLN